MNEKIKSDNTILKVRNLSVKINVYGGQVHAVRNLSFDLVPGECYCIVGESGSGKSVSVQAIMGLLPTPPYHIESGEVWFQDQDLLKLTPAERTRFLGKDLAMIFQDPLSSLNPLMTVEGQIEEVLKTHTLLTRPERKKRVRELLDFVQISDAATRMKQYPHQLSGGMRQRVMIAMALACNPKILIADEPTTALDVTIQSQILNLIHHLSQQLHMATILITHDLGVVARMADRVGVMYAGQIVEEQSVEDLFQSPKHPYTVALLRAVPRRQQKELLPIPGQPPDLFSIPRGCPFAMRCPDVMQVCLDHVPPFKTLPGDLAHVRCWKWEHPQADIVATEFKVHQDSKPLRKQEDLDIAQLNPFVKVSNLTLKFHVGRGRFLHAVDDVSFEMYPGETLGLVGESGCGKSSLGRVLAAMYSPTSGLYQFDGESIPNKMNAAQRKTFARKVQMIFQDPYASLNPRMTIADIISEGAEFHGLWSAKDRLEHVTMWLEKVGLAPEYSHRFPHEFSGGQRQRIGIARALTLAPKLLICDEPVSALDVSVQAQVLSLLQSLQKELGLAYLFIAHGLHVVRHVSNRVAIMYLGKVVEIGPTESVYTKTYHPYTEMLLDSNPEPDPEIESQKLKALNRSDAVELFSPINPGPGCRFAPRCPLAGPECRKETPVLREVHPGHWVACHKRP